MQYNRDVKDPMAKLVNQALIDYWEDIYDVSAGYAILRYTKQGLIGVSAEVNPQVFADWYPLDQGFIILRLAKEGKLFYKKQ
jgi:hypothetical protein